MHTKADFLPEILANPDDDTPRLVFADFLQERGENDRAEFIRVQCELAAIPWVSYGRITSGTFYTRDGATGGHVPTVSFARYKELRQREQATKRGMSGWFPKPFGDFRFHWSVTHAPHTRGYLVHRGFPCLVTCTAAEWLDRADAILAVQPIRQVVLTDEWPGLIPLADCLPGNQHVSNMRRWIGVRPIGDGARPRNDRLADMLGTEFPGVTFRLPEDE